MVTSDWWASWVVWASLRAGGLVAVGRVVSFWEDWNTFRFFVHVTFAGVVMSSGQRSECVVDESVLNGGVQFGILARSLVSTVCASKRSWSNLGLTASAMWAMARTTAVSREYMKASPVVPVRVRAMESQVRWFGRGCSPAWDMRNMPAMRVMPVVALCRSRIISAVMNLAEMEGFGGKWCVRSVPRFRDVSSATLVSCLRIQRVLDAMISMETRNIA